MYGYDRPIEVIGYALLALVASGFGALGGLGGAILLVPALVVTGMPAAEAAPLGLVSVAAASIAAGPRQLRDRSTNHRLGVAMEIVAAAAAVAGATIAGIVSDRALTLGLAGVALVGAVAVVRRSHSAVVADPCCHHGDVGERVGALAGAYPGSAGVVPYVPQRIPLALSMMSVAGFVAGTAGVSGGFVKTPTEAAIMGVPMRVAASTTTFTVGITASAALIVAAIGGRLDPHASTAVVAGSLIGGQIGAHLQGRMPDLLIRRVLSTLLVVVTVVLLVMA